MLKIENVLFPTDFSPGADRALPSAVYFAHTHGAKLHMLHVRVLHADDPGQLEHRFPDERELDGIVERVGGARSGSGPGGRLKVEHTTLRGFAAAPAIIEYAAENEIDLVAMGTHGRRGVRHAMMGSVAEEVVRLAPCPVVTVREREEADHFRPIRRILASTDFSERAELGVRYAAKLAEAFEAELALLHVIEEPVYPDFYLPYIAPPQVTDLEQRASEELSDIVVELGGAAARADYAVRRGTPALEIVEFAGQDESDLIVMATHGLTGLEHVMLGSVTERVIRRAAMPVFVVKTFGRNLI